MKVFYIFFLALLIQAGAGAQTVSVSGGCITGTVVLNKIADIEGRAAYENTGTVAGFPNTPIAIFWMGAPDNFWALAFDGQPYFSNSCNTTLPRATGSTSCPWTALDASTCTGSGLTITGTGTLPVRLTSFTASNTGGNIQLSWKTASEINNKGFEVQRSTDGQNWIKIGFVKGAIDSRIEKSYGFTDEAPAQGRNYYRLMQYDLDDRATASNVANADITDLGDHYLNTNVSSTGLYQLNIRSSQPMEIAVVDMQGKVLIRKLAARGVHQLDISKQPAGVYVLQLRKNNTTVTKKIVKK